MTEKRPERPAGPRLGLLIWDFNGTMLDDLAVAYGSVEYVFRLYDRPVPSKDRFRSLISSRFMEFYHGQGVPTWATAEHLNVIRQDYYLSRMPQLHFRPGLAELLKWSRSVGLKNAVCSAEITVILDTLVDRADLRRYFEPDAVRAEAWDGKSLELSKICEQLNVPRDRAAYLDDTVDGIAAAMDAEVHSIGFAHPTSWNTALRIEAARPLHIVHDFRELHTLLEVLTR